MQICSQMTIWTCFLEKKYLIKHGSSASPKSLIYQSCGFLLHRPSVSWNSSPFLVPITPSLINFFSDQFFFHGWSVLLLASWLQIPPYWRRDHNSLPHEENCRSKFLLGRHCPSKFQWLRALGSSK